MMRKGITENFVLLIVVILTVLLTVTGSLGAIFSADTSGAQRENARTELKSFVQQIDGICDGSSSEEVTEIQQLSLRAQIESVEFEQDEGKFNATLANDLGWVSVAPFHCKDVTICESSVESGCEPGGIIPAGNPKMELKAVPKQDKLSIRVVE